MMKKIIQVFFLIFVVTIIMSANSTLAFAQNQIKIIKQPAKASALKNTIAKVRITVKGDDLKYKWYYKNPGSKKFTLDKYNTKNVYSVKMKKKLNKRKVYCVISDKYGNSVKSKTVSLKIGTPVKLIKQPTNQKLACFSDAVVTLSAKGDGLKYEWYYRDANTLVFKKDKTNKKKTYKSSVDSNISTRDIYCIIKDKYGKSVRTNVITLSFVHSFDTGKILKKATCISTGEKVYTCVHCLGLKTEIIPKTEHSWSSWSAEIKPTISNGGIEKRICSVCSFSERRTTNPLDNEEINTYEKEWFLTQYTIAKNQYINNIEYTITSNQTEINTLRRELNTLHSNYISEVQQIKNKFAAYGMTGSGAETKALKTAEDNFNSVAEATNNLILALESENIVLNEEKTNPNHENILSIVAINCNIDTYEIYTYYYKYAEYII